MRMLQADGLEAQDNVSIVSLGPAHGCFLRPNRNGPRLER